MRAAQEGSDPESGSASVLAVSGVGLLAVTVMLGLGTRVVVERRAVEDSITEMRAYWAAMGHATYGLSRVRYNTNGGVPPAGAGSIAHWAATEIADSAGGKGAALMATWRYPDVSANYFITVKPKESAPDAGNGPAATRLQFDFDTCVIASKKISVNTYAPDALRTISNLRDFEFDYCVISAPDPNIKCSGSGDPKNNYWYDTRIYGVGRPAVPATKTPCG